MRLKIWDLATKKFNKASEVQYKKGLDKYKVSLESFNGRNPFNDAREEVVDLHQYLTQGEAEFDTLARYLYVYAKTEGFWGQLPDYLKERIKMVVDDETLATLCQREGIEFYGTNKRSSAENF